jgi:predicted metal-dependent hydrolase
MQFLRADGLSLYCAEESWRCAGAGFDLPVALKVNARAKRLVLRVSPCGSEIRLTLPKRVSRKQAQAFLQKQLGWLEQQLQQQPERVTLEPGAFVTLFGQQMYLEHRPGMRGAVWEAQALAVGGEAMFFNRRIREAIRKEATRRFGAIARELAAQIDKKIASVSVRDMHSRWGSCTSGRRLSLNWRLAFAPTEVAEYVIAHEVAHLQHFDHSPAFWRCVARLCEEVDKPREWLLREGKGLHRYR